jgi:hypothetical protein
VDLVVAPQVLVQQDSARSALRLNANYYITKQVSVVSAWFQLTRVCLPQSS